MAIKLENIDLTGFELHGHPLPLSELCPKLESLSMALTSGEIQGLIVAPGPSVPQLLPEGYDKDLYDNNYLILVKK